MHPTVLRCAKIPKFAIKRNLSMSYPLHINFITLYPVTFILQCPSDASYIKKIKNVIFILFYYK